MASRNPSLVALSGFLARRPLSLSKSTISCTEVKHDGATAHPQKLDIDELNLKVSTSPTSSIIAVIENIHPNDIELLGSLLDIDPLFFCGHIVSSYQDIERTPPAPLISMLPSRIASHEFFNIHFQKVLDLGDECTLDHMPYKFTAPGNITRAIRLVPALSGRAIGLVRGCISILKKQLTADKWICECFNIIATICKC